ncbi:MAG: hypothetical protein KGI94_15570, partial [Paracoccaceae bacterium]|nr:hypothetical protein [Paracoccaceae bacterium]
MRGWRAFAGLVLAALAAMPAGAQSMREANNAALMRQRHALRGLTAAQVARVEAIFARSPIIGQGNPVVTVHPMTPAECAARIPGGPEGYR